ncbi:hypothetical protein GOBAR_DD26728 [Gossypium barbadense]|nr:hypothetical protein GOBAR_DD26728 [Gossypium barbadense]
MAINLILSDEITTSAQREKVDKMMRELQDYRMKPKEDIVQHLITVNQKMQEVLWKGHELIRRNKVQYLTLRGTLIEREHKIILDQLWKTLVPQIYWNIVIYFVKFIISYRARKIARQSVDLVLKMDNQFFERICVKIVRHCGRMISKLFYKFPVSTDSIKFTEMKLVDDEDVEIMAALYCGNQSDQNAPIQLFAELAGVESTEDPTPLGEQHGAQESCMVVLILYVDSQSTVREIDIDLNAAPETNVVGDNGYDNIYPSDHEVNSDMDEVPDDIDDECVNNNGNVNASLVRN